jgi:hypothetical protein
MIKIGSRYVQSDPRMMNVDAYWRDRDWSLAQLLKESGMAMKDITVQEPEQNEQ